MKISMIASGSKGNMCYVESEGTKILIDCGISAKRMTKYFDEHGISYDFDAILITHEHTDHVSNIKNVSKKLNCPVYMTSGTKRGIIEKYSRNGISPIDECDVRIIGNHTSFDVANLKVRSFPTFHDVYDPTGFVLEDSKSKLVYITDTGYVPQVLYNELANADIYVMETNHDPDMLMQCESRPYETRIRILGDEGHMSNEDALDMLAHVIGDSTKLVFYAHISEECNLNELIDMTNTKVFKGYGMDVSQIKFIHTSQIPSEVYEV